MIRIYIKDKEKKLDRLWFRKQWKETPWIIRQNLYISLRDNNGIWELDFAVPMLEAASRSSRRDKEAQQELGGAETTIELDFVKNLRKELKKKGLAIDNIEYNLKAPDSKAIKKIKSIFGRI